MSVLRVCAWILLLLLADIRELKAQAPPSSGWGTHGMAVFGGREGLYASHLPMFHAPHDAQVIVRFHLEDAATDLKLRQQLAKQPQLWTLEPEAFDLARLAASTTAPLRQFRARFVQGHFERGGSERFADQQVLVDAVLAYRPLRPRPANHSEGRYRLIGTGQEWFLVKDIDRRPDFDIIVALRPTTGVARVSTVLLQSDDLTQPSDVALDVALRAQAGAEFAVRRVLYFETGDLR